jgi:lipopolysaccharide transport system permease protein
MISSLKLLANSKDLLLSWTGRIIRGRYQQSVLGGLWAIIQPAASVIIFSIIFTRFVPVDTGGIPYPIFSYVAVVPWGLFANSISDMTSSLVSNMSLVTKIYFPREALVIASLLARLVDFGISGALLIVFFIIYRVPFYPLGILMLPLVIIIQIIFVIGLGLITAATNIFYRDVQPLLTLVVQLWFYASPIIYPVTMVPEQYRTLYYVNPMAGILESYRAILLNQSLPGSYLYFAGIISIIVLTVGYWFFKRVEHLFADIV